MLDLLFDVTVGLMIILIVLVCVIVVIAFFRALYEIFIKGDD
jgi:hypothetical protein